MQRRKDYSDPWEGLVDIAFDTCSFDYQGSLSLAFHLESTYGPVEPTTSTFWCMILCRADLMRHNEPIGLVLTTLENGYYYRVSTFHSNLYSALAFRYFMREPF